MQTRYFKETETIENNVCIGNVGKYSIVINELGDHYYYNNVEHQLEIGEAVDRENITSIDKLPSDEREAILQYINR